MTTISTSKKCFITALAVLGACVCNLIGQASEMAILMRQDKQIVEANNDLERIYQESLAVLGSRITAGDHSAKQLKDALMEAEGAWLQWRDAEALLRAYGGGAVGGSALKEDLHENLLMLIDERKVLLQKLLESIQH